MWASSSWGRDSVGSWLCPASDGLARELPSTWPLLGGPTAASLSFGSGHVERCGAGLLVCAVSQAPESGWAPGLQAAQGIAAMAVPHSVLGLFQRFLHKVQRLGLASNAPELPALPAAAIQLVHVCRASPIATLMHCGGRPNGCTRDCASPTKRKWLRGQGGQSAHGYQGWVGPRQTCCVCWLRWRW